MLIDGTVRMYTVCECVHMCVLHTHALGWVCVCVLLPGCTFCGVGSIDSNSGLFDCFYGILLCCQPQQTDLCTYTCVCVCVCVCMCVYACVYVCVCVYMRGLDYQDMSN